MTRRRTVSALNADSCSTQCKTEAPCQQAFDDGFIRSLLRKIELGNSAAGGSDGVDAYVALFCADGCAKGNLDPALTACGAAAIRAAAVGAQSFLQTLSFFNEVITRTVNVDLSVTVNVLREGLVTLVSDPEAELSTYGIEILVITPDCCLKLDQFMDLRGFGSCCADP